MFLLSGEGLKLAGFAFRSLPSRLRPAVLEQVREPAGLSSEKDDPVRNAFFEQLQRSAGLGEDRAALGRRINEFCGFVVFEGDVMYEASRARHGWSDDDYAFFAAQVISLLAGNNY